MGAIGPAQITIRDKQIIIVSTMGTAESVFLHDWIERAIGGMPRVAILHWGAGEGVDPYTAEGVASYHPGIGFPLNGKILEPVDVLEQIDRNTRAEYERAYANRRTVTLSNLIPPETWRPLAPRDPATGEPLPLDRPADTRDITLAYDVALDRRAATITAHWVTRDGVPAVQVVRAGPGDGWLVDAVDDLADRWRPRELVAVGHGPVLPTTATLRVLGHDITELGEREYAAACGAFLTRLDDGQLLHDGSLGMEESVTGLVTRPGAVDGIAFSRRHSVGDSSAGIAATAGLWATARNADTGTPLIDFGAA